MTDQMTKIDGKGWLIVAACFTSLSFVLCPYYAGSVVVPEWIKEFGWQRAQIGLLFSAAALGAAIISPLVGWLVDRMEARFTMAIGAGMTGLGMLAISRARSFEELLFWFLVQGMGTPFAGYIPAQYVISNWFTAKRGLALGIAMSGEQVGGMAMALLASYVILIRGWREVYVTLAVPMLLVVIPFALLVIRNRPPSIGSRGIVDERPSLDGFELKEALKTKSFWLIALAVFCGGFISCTVLVHFVVFLIGLGYGAHVAALSLSVMVAFAAVGQPIMGFVGDRSSGRMALVVTYVTTAASLLLILGVGHSSLLLAVFVALYGVMLSANITLFPMVIADSLGFKRFGSISGLMWVLYTAGASVGPPVAGEIFDLTHSYSLALELCVFLSTLSAFAIWSAAPYTRAVTDAMEMKMAMSHV